MDAPKPGIARRRLLLSEPRPGLLTALAVVLSAECSVEVAPAVPEALDRATAWHPHVVVLELDANALEDVCLVGTLASRLRRSRLVIVTDDVGAAVHELRRFPVDGMLRKPVSAERLLARIRSALSLPPVRLGSYTAIIINYVGHHFAQRLTLTTMGRVGAVSPNYLAARFRHEAGMTFKRYLTAMRIEAAKHLLVTTDAKLMAVARQTGFCDDSHLCRVFLGTVGVRPGLYRAEMQARSSWRLSNASDAASNHCA